MVWAVAAPDGEEGHGSRLAGLRLLLVDGADSDAEIAAGGHERLLRRPIEGAGRLGRKACRDRVEAYSEGGALIDVHGVGPAIFTESGLEADRLRFVGKCLLRFGQAACVRRDDGRHGDGGGQARGERAIGRASWRERVWPDV